MFSKLLLRTAVHPISRVFFSFSPTVASIKELRSMSGAPISDCKKVLEETNGDMEEASKILHEKGLSQAEKRMSQTLKAAVGLIGISHTPQAYILTETLCETDFVSRNELFLGFYSSLLKSLEKHKFNGALYDGENVRTLIDTLDSTFNINEELKMLIMKIKEQIVINRILKVNTNSEVSGYYLHNDIDGKFAPKACFVTLKGKDIKQTPELSKLASDIALQVVGIGAKYINSSEVPQDEFDKLKEEIEKVTQGKPEDIKSKIYDSKKKSFLADKVLMESPFILSEDEVSIKDYISSFKSEFGEIEISRIDYWQVGSQFSWKSEVL